MFHPLYAAVRFPLSLNVLYISIPPNLNLASSTMVMGDVSPDKKVYTAGHEILNIEQKRKQHNYSSVVNMFLCID
jgi:hypothetical protein